MVVFLLKPKAILLVELGFTSVLTRNWPTPRYGGALPPFIGSTGVFLAQGARGGLPEVSGEEELESTVAESSMDAVHQR